MNANPVLLQKKYARIVKLFASKQQLTLESALNFFYCSTLYRLVSEGCADMHCMSDEYLSEELVLEYEMKNG